MCWPRAQLAGLLLLVAAALHAEEGYIVGAGLEGDSDGGLALAAMGEIGLGDKTWIAAAVARNANDVEFGADLETWYADLGIDHFRDPVGVDVGVAYWGDSDALDSTDWRASLYWRNDRFSIAGDYQYRDFSFLFPATDRFPGREVGFDANGVGFSTRYDISDSLSVGLSAMNYDYSVNLRLDRNRGLLQLLSFSRLSLINSLIDYRATATLGIDVDKRRWQLDIGTWKGEVDDSTSRSATVRLQNPLTDTTDIEFALGVDHSELYGNVTFFSVFLYFFGGG